MSLPAGGIQDELETYQFANAKTAVNKKKTIDLLTDMFRRADTPTSVPAYIGVMCAAKVRCAIEIKKCILDVLHYTSKEKW
jgi:hypothetical protein